MSDYTVGDFLWAVASVALFGAAIGVTTGWWWLTIVPCSVAFVVLVKAGITVAVDRWLEGMTGD